MDDNTSTQLQEARQLIEAGRPQDALASLVRLLDEDLDNAEAWYLLGMALDDPGKKLFAFRQVLRIEPWNDAALEQVTGMQMKLPFFSGKIKFPSG